MTDSRTPLILDDSCSDPKPPTRLRDYWTRTICVTSIKPEPSQEKKLILRVIWVFYPPKVVPSLIFCFNSIIMSFIFFFRGLNAQLKAPNCACSAHQCFLWDSIPLFLLNSVLLPIPTLIRVLTHSALTLISIPTMSYWAVCPTTTGVLDAKSRAKVTRFGLWDKINQVL